MTLAGGYTYLKAQGPGDFDPETYSAGWLAAASVRLMGRLSGIGEIGVGFRTTAFDEPVRLLGAFGGARWDLWQVGRARVFAQGMVGLERFSEPGFTESGLAMQVGAGVDVAVGRSWLARVQADYRRANQTAGTFDAVRVFVGAGVRLR